MFKKLGISFLLISFLFTGTVFSQDEEIDNEPAEEITDNDMKGDEDKAEKKEEEQSLEKVFISN